MEQQYYLKLSPNLAEFDQFSVHSFQLKESLDHTYSLDLEATHLNDKLPLENFIHQKVVFEMAVKVQWSSADIKVSKEELKNLDKRLWHGVIQSVEQLASSEDETHYRFHIIPRIALLDKIETTRLFQNETALSIVEKILRHHHFSSDDFSLKSRRQLPRYEHRMQYQETDYAFIKRVLAREGLWFSFIQNVANEVFVVGDDLSHYFKNQSNQALFFKPQGGLESQRNNVSAQLESQLSRDTTKTNSDQAIAQSLNQSLLGETSIASFQVKYSAHFAGVKIKDYNYRDANNALLGEAGFDKNPPAAFGRPYVYGFYHHKDNNQAQAYAQIQHEYSISRHIIASGQSNIQTFSPGEIMSFTENAKIGSIRQWLITAVIHQGARDQDYSNQFYAIPAETIWRPQPIDSPIIDGTLSGKVSDAGQGPYAWVDELGRYIVKMDLDLDDWQPGGESRPMRLAKPYAGGQYGQHFPLHKDTEVQLAFQNGDPDRPYIAGVLHNSANPDHIPNTWRTRNVIRTWANNKIRMEDLNGAEHIKMATEFRKTQLNLGHLVDSGREKRGDGFELRTDGWGAVRSAQALYLTTEPQQSANGKQMDRTVALQEIEGALSQAQHLAEVTHKHTGIAPQLASLGTLAEHSANLESPVILSSAVAGIAQTSPQSLLNSVSKDIHQQAGKDIFIGAGENITETAVKSVQLLAQTEDLNLIAGKKTARLASHGSDVEITAAQKLLVQSVGNEILINAKNGIKIASGGAYIEIKGGKITLYSPGPIQYKGVHDFQGPQGGSFPLPELPSSVCLECLRLARQQGVGIVER